MRWEDVMKPLVDVQPAYNALATLDLGMPPEADAFLRHKLRECIKQLRDTSAYLEKQLQTRQPK